MKSMTNWDIITPHEMVCPLSTFAINIYLGTYSVYMRLYYDMLFYQSLRKNRKKIISNLLLYNDSRGIQEYQIKSIWNFNSSRDM